MPINICAVVVTYHSDPALLKQVLENIAPQVQYIVIVDNGSDTSIIKTIMEDTKGAPTELIELGHNYGIATAHNKGIEWAKNNNCTHILIMDQDSTPGHNMVEKLLEAELKLVHNGDNVAAVGPYFIDDRYSDQTFFIKINGIRIARSYCDSSSPEKIQDADYLISSGMLIRLDIIDKIGLMDESLFIDYVDIEWGLRAKSKDYHCFGVCSAIMKHRLGDNTVPSYVTARRVPVRSSIRHYYMFRNEVILYKRSYIPIIWIIYDSYKLLLRYIFYSIMTPPRFKNFRMMNLGLWHGLIGKTGVYKG